MCTSAAAEEGRRPYHSVVIVDISLDRLLGRTSTISGTTMATPRGDRRRRSASRFGFALRALPQRRTYTTSGGINWFALSCNPRGIALYGDADQFGSTSGYKAQSRGRSGDVIWL